jgi:hypothetical protein
LYQSEEASRQPLRRLLDAFQAAQNGGEAEQDRARRKADRPGDHHRPAAFDADEQRSGIDGRQSRHHHGKAEQN